MICDNDAPSQKAKSGDTLVVPVVEEEIAAGVRPVKTGAVRVEKHVERRIRRVETSLLQEEVEIRRLPINRVVAEVPVVRKNGNVVIVPVVEEELVVTRRLVLKEEIHLIKRRRRSRFKKEFPVEKERAEVRRLDSHGRVIGVSRHPGSRGPAT
jgi:uncharacterized protein (TIGR02271 family)